jgi:hypothetical protein
MHAFVRHTLGIMSGICCALVNAGALVVRWSNTGSFDVLALMFLMAGLGMALGGWHALCAQEEVTS